MKESVCVIHLGQLVGIPPGSTCLGLCDKDFPDHRAKPRDTVMTFRLWGISFGPLEQESVHGCHPVSLVKSLSWNVFTITFNLIVDSPDVKRSMLASPKTNQNLSISGLLGWPWSPQLAHLNLSEPSCRTIDCIWPQEAIWSQHLRCSPESQSSPLGRLLQRHSIW